MHGLKGYFGCDQLFDSVEEAKFFNTKKNKEKQIEHIFVSVSSCRHFRPVFPQLSFTQSSKKEEGEVKRKARTHTCQYTHKEKT